jgi:hypothetical protein
MVRAKINPQAGVNTPEQANKLLLMLQAAWQKEVNFLLRKWQGRPDRFKDSRYWVIAKEERRNYESK